MCVYPTRIFQGDDVTKWTSKLINNYSIKDRARSIAAEDKCCVGVGGLNVFQGIASSITH